MKLTAALALFCLAAFVQPQTRAESTDATLQALLKEVHALRIALEQSNRIGPTVQIALAQMQLQEERVRSATRQLQEARDRVLENQTRRTELVDHLKQLEAQQTQTVDATSRNRMDTEVTTIKAAIERFNVTDQQYRAKEADANSLLLTEQGRWNESNDRLRSLERTLTAPQQ